MSPAALSPGISTSILFRYRRENAGRGPGTMQAKQSVGAKLGGKNLLKNTVLYDVACSLVSDSGARPNGRRFR